MASTFLLMAVFASALSSYMTAVGQENVNVNDTLVEIPYGSSLRRVSAILAQAGLIDDEARFFWYMRLGRDDGHSIQAGYYNFAGVLTKSQIASRLQHGIDQSFRFTFKEGQTLIDLVRTLEYLQLSTTEEFIEAMNSEDILSLIQLPYDRVRTALANDVGGLEGYLFPDTYFFTKKDKAKGIIKKMYARFLAKLDTGFKEHMDQEKKTLHEVLTLASIIEKETGDTSERSLVSSVYHNRLKRNMRLQADPTVIYGLKDYDGKIRKKDLLTKHSYNTYVINGLPPGPIASAGLESIKAALYPANTDYLYFVSKNDGTHVFCENLSCHNKAVKLWQVDYFKKSAQQ